MLIRQSCAKSRAACGKRAPKDKLAAFPTKCVGTQRARKLPLHRGLGINAAQDGDVRLAEDVDHLSFLEARGVVFEPEAVIGFVNPKTSESVGVGKESQGAKLAGLEWGLKFVCDFNERHDGRIIARAEREAEVNPGERWIIYTGNKKR